MPFAWTKLKSWSDPLLLFYLLIYGWMIWGSLRNCNLGTKDYERILVWIAYYTFIFPTMIFHICYKWRDENGLPIMSSLSNVNQMGMIRLTGDLRGSFDVIWSTSSRSDGKCGEMIPSNRSIHCVASLLKINNLSDFIFYLLTDGFNFEINWGEEFYYSAKQQAAPGIGWCLLFHFFAQ
jgi:hypothetical protein